MDLHLDIIKKSPHILYTMYEQDVFLGLWVLKMLCVLCTTVFYLQPNMVNGNPYHMVVLSVIQVRFILGIDNSDLYRLSLIVKK